METIKKIFFTLILISGLIGHSQITVGLNDGYWLEDMPTGSYIKDINGDFDKFDGTWVWTNGLEKVTFKLQKVTHQLFPCGSYEDYMIGNYSYTKDYGLEIVVNTIGQTISNLPENHPMYANDPKYISKISFTFKDVVLNKDSCSADFEFLPGSTTQMTVKLRNPEMIGLLVTPENPNPVYEMGFTLPNNITLTKQ